MDLSGMGRIEGWVGPIDGLYYLETRKISWPC